MRNFILVLVATCFLNNSTAQLTGFEWLEGEWTVTSKKGGQRMEIWKKMSDTLYTGKGVKVAGVDTVLLETLELSYRDGNAWYIPTVTDQNEGKPVRFKMVKSGDNQFVFENPEHDFPQRILYHYHPAIKNKADADSLFVRVESLEGNGIDFWFRKI